jgi:predicted transcriptional regulator
MSELKGTQAKISIRRDTHARLKAIAEQNNCSLSQLIEDAVAKLEPGISGNIYTRLDRIEKGLQELGTRYALIYLTLDKILDALKNNELMPTLPSHTKGWPFQTEADLKKQQRHLNKLAKLNAQDEEEYQKAVAAGEVPARPQHNQHNNKISKQ